MYTNLREQVGNDLEIHFSHWFQWMFFLLYHFFFFITTKPILFYFQIIAVNKTYRKSNSNYDNISHVKEAFTLESQQQKKKVYVEKLKN